MPIKTMQVPRPNSFRSFPLAVAITVFVVLAGISVVLSSRSTGGRFIYPLDDTYITMSIAKNFAQSGVWGVTRHEFSSASSTPLFALLLAGCYRLTGANEWWPLVLSLLSSLLALAAADRWLRPLPNWLRTLGLLAAVLFVPLYVVALTGMEHCLHIFLSLVFLWLAARGLETGETDGRLLLLAPVMVLIRFESLFLIGICAGLFLVRKRYRFGVGLLLAAGCALAADAAFLLAHGGEWLPNSILMKGVLGGKGDLLHHILVVCGRPPALLLAVPHVGVIFLALLAIYVGSRNGTSFWDRRRVALFISMAAILAHLEFAQVGWVYRYEAYLLALGDVCIFSALPSTPLRGRYSLVFALIGCLAVSVLGYRAWDATGGIRRASFNIYEQQYQMARFVSQYYPTASVAANDIGWIAFASDIRLLDLTGLADQPIFQAKRSGSYTTALMESEQRRADPEIAIVFDSWFAEHSKADLGGPSLPPGWARVGRWSISDNLVQGDSTVSFYAVRPSGVPKLRASLAAFEPSLPGSVSVLQN